MRGRPYQLARREHGVTLSYSGVKQMLQGAGLLKRSRARGRQPRRRERKACLGEKGGGTPRFLAAGSA